MATVSSSDDDEYFAHVLTHRDPPHDDEELPGPVAEWRRFWHRCWRLAGGSDATRLARAQGFVATPAQLARLDFTKNDLRRERRRGTWCSPARGAASPVVIDGTDPLAERRRHALVATAHALTHEAAAICGRSGAILYGLPTLAIPERPEMTSPPVLASGVRRGAIVRRARMAYDDIVEWYGAPVLSVARTLADLGRHNRFDAIMAADAALREGLVDQHDLDRSIAQARGWPGIRRARAVLALADPRSESPLESVLRLRLHEDGFPKPEPQVWIDDPARRRRYRVDLLIAEHGLVIEADGRIKYTADALWKEKQRETRLRAMGFRVERVVWSDVLSTWPETAARLWAVIRTP